MNQTATVSGNNTVYCTAMPNYVVCGVLWFIHNGNTQSPIPSSGTCSTVYSVYGSRCYSANVVATSDNNN